MGIAPTALSRIGGLAERTRHPLRLSRAPLLVFDGSILPNATCRLVCLSGVPEELSHGIAIQRPASRTYRNWP